MRDQVLAVWRAGVFLLAGALTGLVSLFALPFVLVLALVARPVARQLLTVAIEYERRRTAAYTGRPIPEAAEPDTWRHGIWFVTHALTGTVVGLVGAAVPAAAINALLVPLYWWAAPKDDPVAAPYPVTSWTEAAFMPLLAAGYALVSLWITPWLARTQSRFARWLLSPPPGARLAERVAELTASRAAALEAHGAELRRIERDLHDDTQNRIVAVAMHLGIIERVLRRDPAAALPLVLKAQDAASDALVGLRGVVRSIYPPVLAERGLDGAIAGLIARSAVPTTLTVTDLTRAPAAVESAAYFVVAEALTNVAKHSGAEHCEVHLTGRDPVVIEVRDDGHGGADEAGGTGLTGIRRRVAAFDGTTSIDSPTGGPTVLRVELPCGS
ncbi:sensor histidine kinase [Actinophytocola sp.]|uniref:sensor histidine kinase n=1 Tax=Actinophytocola sp. TaxID=1872138 RepID=UPI002D240DBB|nr:sensor domain-containing protein [Actinophytocola sp.]HYQ66560.1 sensor domain-containing protein [Actinophytocola sp.]